MTNFSDFIAGLRSYLRKNDLNSDFLQLMEDVSFTQDKIIIYAKNVEDKNIISKKSSTIGKYLKSEHNSDYRISIIVLESNPNASDNENEASEATKSIDISSKIKTIAKSKNGKSNSNLSVGSEINPNMTFNSFVVGNNSMFAFNVCKAIAKNPGLNYNPCLLYGASGLGKTHLVQAIGNEIIENLGLNVCYISCDNFIKEYGEAAGTGKMNEYIRKFDDASVLIADDIQFLEGKTGIQEGFFNIFNTLKNKNKQIVCTSDKPTSDFNKFEQRLSSRISEGVIATLSAPDEETRYAIIKRKFSERNLSIDDKYIKYIAERIITNVRDLEGTVKTLIAYSELIHEEINIKLINEVIKDKVINDKENEKIDGNLIIDTVIESMNVNKKDLLSKKRTKTIVFQRDCCAYLMNLLTEMTHTEIGIMLGGRDHSTIIHSIDKMKEQYQNDVKTKNIIDNLKEEIKRKSL